jgi:hypothetical protein
MSVLSQAFFALVSRHLMSFSFLSAGHLKLILKMLFNLYVAFYFTNECFSRLESWNIVSRNNNGRVL